MPKPQRIRDPLHDLIEFDTSDFEQLMWEVVNTDEFQRLRRVKQLGFSELVYPGATHSRFAHSIGVFHTARKLTDVIAARTGHTGSGRSDVAKAAALVHDLGHGPFSHAFEDAIRQIDRRKGGKPKKHELWTSDILLGDTEVGATLSKLGGSFLSDVAKLLTSEIPSDIYHAVVSSQFDADRLDYMRRDRLMTGAQHGGFDFSWLIANLEVKPIHLATDGEVFQEVDSLILGTKALQAAESYVLGLFHLYFTVYFHKATRSAEKMLSAILARVAHLVEHDDVAKTGLPSTYPVIEFLSTRSLSAYLRMDDFVVWSALTMMRDAPDPICSDLSRRLLDRRLYKAIDVGELLDGEPLMAFRARIQAMRNDGELQDLEVIEDQASRNPYKRRSEDSPEALSKIHIWSGRDKAVVDLAARSDVVKQLQERRIYRVYVRDEDAKAKIDATLSEWV